ncbi:MAG: CYTH domain-containing protein [Candidatus Omnitrophica bacterium]|nr:CYTH domain-containing protein [Candidatus Omnitrophota bacterium]MDD5352771.1 CYTH domain-containing protein [Candidatus Omnitrophota bacterium]MDD5550370.1 CYTH domain-containing protein [Candidatus Omnitrophota bacterium]
MYKAPKKIYLILNIIIAVVFSSLVYSDAEAVISEEQIKLDVQNELVFDYVRNFKYILTYKIKHIGEYSYQDYYYDTPDLAIFNLGYLYRFRVRDKGSGSLEYGLQFKKEYDVNNKQDFQRTEIDDVIPEEMALKILSGNWSEAFSSNYDLRTIKEFRKFLEENKIDTKSLSPLIYGQQKRSRFSLKEDGKLYFEISLDKCSFNLINDARKKEINFLQLEFENKFKGDRSAMDQREERIQDLIMFFTQNFPTKVERDSKYRTVVRELIKK